MEKALVRAVWWWQRAQARGLGASGHLEGGAVAMVQYFGSHLQLTPHVHLLVAEAVWDAGGQLVVVPPPDDAAVESVLRRLLRQLAKTLPTGEPPWEEDEYQRLQAEVVQERLGLHVESRPRRRLVAVLEGYSAHLRVPSGGLRPPHRPLAPGRLHQAASVRRLVLPLLYRHEADKFGAAGLTPVPSKRVSAPRVAECPVQLEAVLTETHPMCSDDPEARGRLVGLEVRVVRIHVEESIAMEGHADRIDPAKWRPLLMSFSQFFGLGPSVHPSRLAEIPESLYRPFAAQPTPETST